MGDLFGGGQADAAKDAAKYSADATKYASDIQMQQFEKLQQNLAPYMGAGQTGLMALMGMLGLPAGGISAGGGPTEAQLRQQLLPQFTTPGSVGQPPSLQSLLTNGADRGYSSATWGFDPAANKWGYNLTYQGGGDSGNPFSKWVYADPTGGSAGTVDEAGLQAAIQQAMAGQTAQNQQAYGAMSGLGKLLQTPFSFDASDLENTPGYQFTKSQGLKSLANQNAAKGLGLSGAQQKGALEYATGLADNTFGQQYNRALQSYMTNYGMASDMFNRLSGLTSMGQNAAAGVGNAGMQTASTLGNLAMQNAQTAGQAGMAGAQANQSILPNMLNAGMAGAGIYGLLGGGAAAAPVIGGSLIGASGAGLGGTLGPWLAASDVRVKEDISLLGKTNGGHNLYRFKYIGHEGYHIGVMAQEIENAIPDAVVEIGGVKHVDYSKVS